MNSINKIQKYWRKRDEAKDYMKWIFVYARSYIPQLGLLLCLDLIGTLLSVGMAIIGKRLIDNASQGNISELTSAIITYILVILIGQLLSVISNLISIVVYEKFGFGIRKKVYRRILDTCWIDISKYHTGDLMTRLTSDVSAVSDGISTTIPTIIRLVVELAVTFFTLAYYDIRLALFALLVAPFTMLASIWLGKKLKYLQVKVQETESKYRSFMQESLANILIEKSFCLEDYSEEKLTRLRDERIYWVFKKNRTNLFASTAMGLSFQIAYIVLASAGRIIEIQQLPKEEYLGKTIRNESLGVKVSHVSFGYSEDLVFEDASLDIKPGDFAAIVGKSGIGKTTLVRLIMAFTKNMKGNITFYNSCGDQIECSPDAREFIAYVPQGNTLFSGTIRENILMGKKDATDEEIMSALDSAAALDFIKELPKGIDTLIGEKGVGISEGQAQRLSIARALVRKAPFLILDEATSSLDEATELRVLEGIRNLNPAPTCLVITHRKSILKYCNREIVIADKKMREAI